MAGSDGVPLSFRYAEFGTAF
eukprot:COSAG03_NODE_14506_length_462_cov_0.647383_1_plen_20_part_10